MFSREEGAVYRAGGEIESADRRRPVGLPGNAYSDAAEHEGNVCAHKAGTDSRQDSQPGKKQTCPEGPAPGRRGLRSQCGCEAQGYGQDEEGGPGLDKRGQHAAVPADCRREELGEEEDCKERGKPEGVAGPGRAEVLQACFANPVGEVEKEREISQAEQPRDFASAGEIGVGPGEGLACFRRRVRAVGQECRDAVAVLDVLFPEELAELLFLKAGLEEVDDKPDGEIGDKDPEVGNHKAEAGIYYQVGEIERVPDPAVRAADSQDLVLAQAAFCPQMEAGTCSEESCAGPEEPGYKAAEEHACNGQAEAQCGPCQEPLFEPVADGFHITTLLLGKWKLHISSSPARGQSEARSAWVRGLGRSKKVPSRAGSRTAFNSDFRSNCQRSSRRSLAFSATEVSL